MCEKVFKKETLAKVQTMDYPVFKKLWNQRWWPRNDHKDVEVYKFLAIKTYKP